MSEDALTGLHDRKAFVLALRRQIGQANERQDSLALAVVDIDGFAGINVVQGYEFGDRVLKHVAKCLGAVARPQDLRARASADNRFALILPRIMNTGHAGAGGAKAVPAARHALPVGRGAHAHLGVGGRRAVPSARFPPRIPVAPGRSARSPPGRVQGRHCQFPPDAGVEGHDFELWDLELDLAGAIQRGEMHLLYQPKVRCSDGRPGRRRGADALEQRLRGAALAGPVHPIAGAHRTDQVADDLGR
jgi:hypothetical protein